MLLSLCILEHGSASLLPAKGATGEDMVKPFPAGLPVRGTAWAPSHGCSLALQWWLSVPPAALASSHLAAVMLLGRQWEEASLGVLPKAGTEMGQDEEYSGGFPWVSTYPRACSVSTFAGCVHSNIPPVGNAGNVGHAGQREVVSGLGSPAVRIVTCRLMKCVRLPLLSRDFLMSNVDTELLVRHHSECKDLLIEALKYHLMPEQRGVLSNSRTRPRRCEGASTVLFAVGGGSLFAIHGDCEAYDTRTDRWHMVASMSTRRARVGVAAIGNKLYAVGGYDGTSDLATVESYDPVTNSWQPEVSMGTRRSCLGVAALHGLLYAAGGYDGASCLNSAERYDPLTGTWTSIAAMSTRRRYVRVATLEGNLYAVGGYDSSSHLATVEKYEPQINTWTPIANMLSRRSSAGVAVLEGMLYVAGGNDGTSCLNSVERYNPKTNTWESVAPMNIRRSTHDLVAMDGWLYAVGGNDGSSSLNSIEKYNPRTNKWVAASCMFTRRSSVGVAVLELLNFPPPSSPTLSVSSTSL
ncbi:kelch-like protein 17 isoform X2 [Calonectris borealis]|uniref:kelch-like protein 17 isoform X2 n=1 Tax=Calonectris borealis TaxID=1323832 RepID=UPI003F4C8974